MLNHPRSRLPQFVSGPVPGTSSRHEKSASTARHPIGICQTAVLREPITISRTRVRSTLRTLEFWLSVRLKVNLHDVLNLSSIPHDVIDLLSISIDVLNLLCDPKRHPRPSSGDMAACSLQAFVHLLLSQVFRSHVGGISTPGTFTMVSSRRATASCTHQTWVWRRLTRPTPRLEAIAFDAVASTRTRGFNTFAISAAMATARCTLGQRVKLRFT